MCLALLACNITIIPTHPRLPVCSRQSHLSQGGIACSSGSACLDRYWLRLVWQPACRSRSPQLSHSIDVQHLSIYEID